jgi:hypothetical protein
VQDFAFGVPISAANNKHFIKHFNKHFIKHFNKHLASASKIKLKIKKN